ncbi:MAG TPA: mycofactocin biosynthesis glycosyltransferase MftF [Solirubrobacterales bacterium]|nr:mycofactocin biosynthesis glycosyltransferase MftF [Solirubrobacterales bacterium]
MSSAATARFELDPSVRRRGGGRLLVGGVPPRLVRLSETGVAALDSLLCGVEGGSGDAGDGAAAALAARLIEGGLLHPLPGDGRDDPPVTTVVPVLDGGERLAGLVRALVAEGPVIVVDDGSRDGSAERAAAAGALVIANVGRRGPAGARNTGLRAAGTELVAFIDADCVVGRGWRDGLAELLAADPMAALVAPRVRGAPGTSTIARYERGASPLDLGPSPSRVGHRNRISYLPAAALLARRDALLELGGFDESMRFGEDVDLLWRLLAAGRSARYVPSREVLHLPRPTVRAFAAQRAGYGGSAPELARRHGSAVAPLRLGRHTTAVWLVAALRPGAAPAALAASLAIVARRGSDRDARIALARIALRGHADAADHLARTLLREWLPISLVLASRSRRARRALAVAAAIESARALRPATRPADIALPALRGLDHASYAVGLWREVVRRRDLSALTPTTETAADRLPRSPAS